MSIILLDGCDKTGKSTIARMMATELNAEIVHCEKPKKPPFREYFDLVDGLARDRNYILDRAWLSEVVYSQLWRERRQLIADDVRFIEQFARSKHSAVAIHAKASSDSVISRMRSDGELLLQPEQVQKCLSLFEDAFKETTLTMFNYVSDVMPAEKFMTGVYPVVAHTLRYQKLRGE